MKIGTLFVVTAPSGAGKTTLVQAVLDRIGNKAILDRVVTYTTRSMRAHEVSGIDYHFVSESDFLYKIEQGEFLEWSFVYGNYYGSPSSIIDNLQKGLSYIMVLDAAGVRTLQQKQIPALYIKVAAGSLQVLQDRLMSRAQNSLESTEIVQNRMQSVEKELGLLEGISFDHVIENIVLIDSISRLEALIRAVFGA